MAAGKEKEIDFYAILGLKKECSALELRNAYKKLALRWHPDRCSASGNAKYVDESKKKFQAIQEAYSVLSDANKRLLYDVGVYDSDDDDDAMDDFLGEMAFMMSQSNGNEQESFEDLQDLFEEMFYRDMNVFSSSSQPDNFHSKFSSSNNNNNKRNCSITNREKVTVSNSDFSSYEAADSLNMRTFCVGAEGTNSESSDRGRRRKNGRKQKVSSNHDMSSRNAKISA